MGGGVWVVYMTYVGGVFEVCEVHVGGVGGECEVYVRSVDDVWVCKVCVYDLCVKYMWVVGARCAGDVWVFVRCVGAVGSEFEVSGWCI